MRLSCFRKKILIQLSGLSGYLCWQYVDGCSYFYIHSLQKLSVSFPISAKEFYTGKWKSIGSFLCDRKDNTPVEARAHEKCLVIMPPEIILIIFIERNIFGLKNVIIFNNADSLHDNIIHEICFHQVTVGKVDTRHDFKRRFAGINDFQIS